MFCHCGLSITVVVVVATYSSLVAIVSIGVGEFITVVTFRLLLAVNYQVLWLPAFLYAYWCLLDRNSISHMNTSITVAVCLYSMHFWLVLLIKSHETPTTKGPPQEHDANGISITCAETKVIFCNEDSWKSGHTPVKRKLPSLYFILVVANVATVFISVFINYWLLSPVNYLQYFTLTKHYLL